MSSEPPPLPANADTNGTHSPQPSPTSTSRNSDDFIDVGRAVKIEKLKVHHDHLEIHYSLDDSHSFLTKVLYPRGTLSALQSKYPAPSTPLQLPPGVSSAFPLSPLTLRLFAHIALIESLKFIATFPRTLDITSIAGGLSQHSLDFFTLAASRAWSQHYFENDVHDYTAPKFIIDESIPGAKLLSGEDVAPLARVERSDADPVGGGVLSSNGGGKDSYLSVKLLTEAGLPFHVFQHARSEYGRFDHQHNIQHSYFPHVPRLADGSARVHEISIIDDWTDGSVMSLLNPRLRGDATKGYPCQVGWPEMVFEALPFMLIHNYTCYSLGNERSADSAQASSALSDGRSVNHQWLKSFEACQALRSFIRQHLVADVEVFSILKPLHDYRIYRLIQQWPAVLPTIHSCNIIKPWCKRCPKCAYVWVNLVAIFGYDAVFEIFRENLWSEPSLYQSWVELLGLGRHNAFECVGEVDETRLAFRTCIRNEEAKAQGKAVELFKQSFVDKEPSENGTNSASASSLTTTTAAAASRPIPIDWAALESRFNRVYSTDHGIPRWLYDKVRPHMLKNGGID